MVQNQLMKTLDTMSHHQVISEVVVLKHQYYQVMLKSYINMLYLMQRVSIGMQWMKMVLFTGTVIGMMEKFTGMVIHHRTGAFRYLKKFKVDLIK